MRTESWYKIAAKEHGDDDDASSAEILIYGEIGANFWGDGIAAEDLVKELAELDVAKIDVRINSVGGQVFEGLAIFNALDRHPAEVTTHIDGMAASIASIVALAGDEVRIAENAFVMIHNPWGVAIGDANEMRSMGEILDKLGGSLADIYAAKTGEKHNAIRKLMDAETWFNASEALELGMVDTISPAMAIAASGDLSRFQNVPTPVAERSGGAGDQAAITASLEAVAQTLEALASRAERLELEELAASNPGLDPVLVKLALDTERTLERTLL